MSSTELRPFSYVVLVLVGQGGAGPPDLVRLMRAQGGLYWAAAESHWYAEPKRLERLGYLRSRKEPGRTTERTEYELTKRGVAALREWLKQPSPFPRIQHEAVVRVLAADFGSDEDVLESLSALEEEIATRRVLVDEALERAKTLPHRERQLRLVHRLGSLLLDEQEQWLQDVRSELSRSA